MINNIFMIIGPSGAGKDSIYNRLIKDLPALHPIVQYTTRPRRKYEEDSKTYFFVSEDEFNSYDDIIDKRSYDMCIDDDKRTVYYGNRYSFFNDTDDKIDYICITTLEGLEQFLSYDKIDNNLVCPFFIEVPKKERIRRIIDRDINKSNLLNMNEINRRTDADDNDFSDSYLGYISDTYNKDIYVIDGNKPLPQVVTDIKKIMFNKLDNKSALKHAISIMEKLNILEEGELYNEECIDDDL